MPILGAMQSASIRLMGQRPTVFFGASQNFEIEISDLVNEVAKDVVASADWQDLIAINAITGDGTTTEFDLPDDYDKMVVTTGVQDTSSWFWGYWAMTDINQFLYQESIGFQPYPGGWIIYGGKIRFVPAPPTDQNATFPYVSKNYARDAGTLETKPEFTSDTDEFLLPDRLLTLGLVWRWRENKKLDFTGDQEAFMKAISEYAAKDKGTRVYRRGSYTRIPGTYTAWPWALGGA